MCLDMTGLAIMAGRLSARHSRVPLSEMHSALLALQIPGGTLA